MKAPAIPRPTANEIALASHAGDIVDQINRAVLVSGQDASQMTDLLKVAKMKFDQLEAERRALVDPLNGVVKVINERFKAITAPLQSAVADGKAKLAPLLTAKASGNYASASTRTKFGYTVTNFDSVPAEFKLIDDAKVTAVLKAGGKIRGIKRDDEEVVVIR